MKVSSLHCSGDGIYVGVSPVFLPLSSPEGWQPNQLQRSQALQAA